jgi:hypothetical protein
MGGRARISPPPLWVREGDGEIREGLLFAALELGRTDRDIVTNVNLPFSRAGVGTNFPGFFIQGLCFGLGAGGLWAAIVLVRRGVQTTSGRD